MPAHSTTCLALRKTAHVSLCAIALLVAACAAPRHGEVPPDSPEIGKAAAALRKLNPAAVQAYALRVRLANVPGPFETVQGTAQYDVQNPGRCGRGDAFAGAMPRISSNEPFDLVKVAEGEYLGTIHLDRIIDEAYYGREVCHWALAEVRVALAGKLRPESTRFVAGMDAASIQQQGVATRYFWGGYYPRATMDAFKDLGDADLEDVPPEKRSEFFSISLSAAPISR